MFLNKAIVAYLSSVLFVLLSIIIGVSAGTMSIPFSDIVHIIFSALFHLEVSGNLDESVVNIVMEIRLPRVVLAFLVGASLSLAGAAFQGLLQNPLADPYTLGVSSGAALGAVFVMYMGLTIPFVGNFTLPFVSIVSGFLTLLLILFFARLVEKQMSMETIILTGIIFSSFLGACISLLIALTGEEMRQIIMWLMGSVSMRGWEYVNMILPFTCVGAILLLMNARELNALAFGEGTAQHLGVNVQRRKMVILSGASFLTGASVAVSGTIGFVGLVMPHLTRMVWGANHHILLPVSMLNGGAFLILADMIARTMISPRELPIGVITALIGGPVFGFIFYNRQRRKL